MNLPKDFQIRMKELLKDEYEDFLKSYDENKSHGLRVNTLKISIDDFIEKSPFSLKKIQASKVGAS